MRETHSFATRHPERWTVVLAGRCEGQTSNSSVPAFLPKQSEVPITVDKYHDVQRKKKMWRMHGSRKGGGMPPAFPFAQHGLRTNPLSLPCAPSFSSSLALPLASSSASPRCFSSSSSFFFLRRAPRNRFSCFAPSVRVSRCASAAASSPPFVVIRNSHHHHHSYSTSSSSSSSGRPPTFFDESLYVNPEAAAAQAGEEEEAEEEEAEDEEEEDTEQPPGLVILDEEDVRAAMGKQPKPRRCPGCGCVLQSQDPLQVGYRPPLVNAELEGHSADSLICQRCYNLRFHNRLSPIRVPYQELKEHLHIIKQVRALVVKIVDVFDFSGSFIEDFGKVVGANPVILVANKSDLLPKGMKEERVLSWVKSTAADELRLGNLRAVHLVSAKTGQGIDELSRAIERMRRGRDVFVLGCTNVGKSTLMNRLITKSAKGPSAKTITTSPLPGTTLNLIGFPLGTWNPKKLKKRQLRKAKIYDTPGIINDHQMANYLKASELRFTTPSKRIKPKLYRLVPGKTLFFGGLGRIDYIQGPESMIFSVFMSHKLPIHPTAAEKADEVYRTQLGLRLYPPFRFSSSAESENDELEHQQGERMDGKKTMQKADTAEVERVKVGGIATEEKEKATEVIRYSFGDEFLEEELEPLDVTSWNDEIQRDIKLPPLKPHELIIPRKDLNEGWGKAFLDVVFSGLGWVSLTGPKYRPDFDEEDVKLVVHLPEGTGLFIREPLMPFEATATHHIKRHGRILRRRQEENEQEEEGEERQNDTKQEEGDEQEKEEDDNENQKEEDEANKRKEEGESFDKREKRLKQKKNKKARFKDKYNRLVEKNKGKGFLTKIMAQRKVKESRLTNERPDFKPLPPSSSS